MNTLGNTVEDIKLGNPMLITVYGERGNGSRRFYPVASVKLYIPTYTYFLFYRMFDWHSPLYKLYNDTIQGRAQILNSLNTITAMKKKYNRLNNEKEKKKSQTRYNKLKMTIVGFFLFDIFPEALRYG